MAKIILNNKEFNIDDAVIASINEGLKNHLLTTMAGSGATITLDGTTYNVDSTKLATVKNDFVAHLGTIVGNSTKVIINGVEYGVDSTKLSGAISELEAMLGGLSSGGDSDSNVITWDGNIEGHEVVGSGDGLYLVKVSDVFILREQAIGGTVVSVSANGSTETVTINEKPLEQMGLPFADPLSWGCVGQGVIGVHSAETITVDGSPWSVTAGLYFVYIEGWMHVSSFTPASDVVLK